MPRLTCYGSRYHTSGPLHLTPKEKDPKALPHDAMKSRKYSQCLSARPQNRVLRSSIKAFKHCGLGVFSVRKKSSRASAHRL